MYPHDFFKSWTGTGLPLNAVYFFESWPDIKGQGGDISMIGLKEPSPEIASGILTEVGFDDRLIGYRISERKGASQVTMYSFGEAVNLFKNQFPRIDFSLLENWIRNVFLDIELADGIAFVVRTSGNDIERCAGIRGLMEKRLEQCKRIKQSRVMDRSVTEDNSNG